jgi:hypothetical protein
MFFHEKGRMGLEFGQCAVYKTDRDGPLADCRRNALYTTGAHIAHSEDAREAALKQLRCSLERPRRGDFAWCEERQVATSEDEPVGVKCYTASNPFRVG